MSRILVFSPSPNQQQYFQCQTQQIPSNKFRLIFNNQSVMRAPRGDSTHSSLISLHTSHTTQTLSPQQIYNPVLLIRNSSKLTLVETLGKQKIRGDTLRNRKEAVSPRGLEQGKKGEKENRECSKVAKDNLIENQKSNPPKPTSTTEEYNFHLHPAGPIKEDIKIAPSISDSFCSTDRKIQQLIDSNAPKMTKDKEYYVIKLIECENTLRVQQKRAKELQKSEAEVSESLIESKASEMMYRTELVAIQKTQLEKVEELSNMQFKLSQLEEKLSHKEMLWSASETNFGFEITSLKEKLEGEQLMRARLEQSYKECWQKASQQHQSQEMEEKIKANTSLLESQNVDLVSQNRDLQSRIQELENENIEASIKLQSFESISTQLSSFEDKFLSAERANQEVHNQFEEYRINKEKELESHIAAQSRLRIELTSLQESLDSKLEQEETGVNRLKASHHNLKFENIGLKKLVEDTHNEQAHQHTVLKARNLELEKELRELRDTTLTDKEASLTILADLKGQLTHQRTKSSEWEINNKQCIETWAITEQHYIDTIQEMRAHRVESEAQLQQLETTQETNATLTQLTATQTQQISQLTATISVQQEQIFTFEKRHKELSVAINDVTSSTETLDSIRSLILSQQEKEGDDFTEFFSALNSLLGKEYNLWSLLTNNTPSTHKAVCSQILKQLSLEEEEGWESAVVQSISSLKKAAEEASGMHTKQQEKIKYQETRLHVCKEEDQRKTLIISDLKSNIKLTEKSLNDASDQLLKCTSLLQQANQKIISAETKLLDAKSELSIMYSELKAENEATASRSQSVEVQLKDLLSKHYEGFYDQIVQRAPEELLRLEVFLFKVFLSSLIETNHGIKQVFATSAYMEDLMAERAEIMGEIRQYYKQLLEPEIAQYLVHYRPVSQIRSNRFQGS